MIKVIIGLILVSGVKTTPRGVKFEYYNPDAKQVYLAGEFNEWSTTSLPMRKEKDGTWWIVIKLSPGKYEYKFVVDGQWVADPDNPVTVGAYGNSLVRIGENFEVLPPQLQTNTPMSSIVYFHGNGKAFLIFEKDSVDSRYRLVDDQEDFKLDIETNIEDKIILWTRLRYNTVLYKEESQLIPVKFERGRFKVSSGNLGFVAFYNIWDYQSDDPFILMGEEGEFHDKFGVDEQGLRLYLNRFLFLDRTDFLYSNNISSDRDLMFSRTRKALGPIDLGFSYRRMQGLNRTYKVASPDSLMKNDSLIYFNTYENDNFLAFDISFGSSRRFYTSFGLGKRTLKAGEYYEGDSPLPTSRSWEKSRITLFKTGIEMINKNLQWGFSVQYDRHYYTDLFIKSDDRDFRYIRTSIYLNLGNNIGLNVRYIKFNADSLLPWNFLFEDYENTRLEYFEFPLIGYDQYIVFAPWVRFKLWRLGIKYHGKLARYALNENPTSFENLIQLNTQIKKFNLLYDLRIYKLKSSFLKVDKTWFDHYMEVSYPVAKKAYISIGYGLKPYDLDDRYIARRAYLIDRGVDNSLLVNNFRGYGGFLEQAEDALEAYKGVQLWFEISF